MFDTHKYIQVIPVGMLETNCVLIQNPVSNILYVIDPGGDAPKILRKIQEFQNISAYRIVLTHAHFDHISAAGQVAEALNLNRVYVGSKDIPLYKSPDNAYPPYFPPAEYLPAPDSSFPCDEGLTIIPCPGHTPGGVSFYFNELHTVAAGDTLFYCGIGRTDFPGGNYDEITDSIRNRLYHLPDDTRVIAGHGADTTIGFEKKHNHYIPAL